MDLYKTTDKISANLIYCMGYFISVKEKKERDLRRLDGGCFVHMKDGHEIIESLTALLILI
jgi:hypothetical protein